MAGYSGSTFGAAKSYIDKEIDKAIVGSSTPKGKWSALSNTPPLTNGSGVSGDYYDVIEAGTFNGETYEVGDIVKRGDDGVWYKVATHVEVDSVKQSEQKAESYANKAEDKANQSENSAVQSGTYATQAGNYAVDAMNYRDEVIGKFWQGDMEAYNEAVKKGLIRPDTIAFIMQESA